MDAELRNLLEEYEDVFNSQHFDEAELDYSALDRHIQSLSQLNVVEQSSISIFDLYKRKHLYLSSGFETILGYNIAEANETGNDYFNSRFHPDDLLQSLQVGNYFLKMGFRLPPAERKDYKLINEYRLRSRNDKYIRVIEQFQALELDSRGNVWLALCILDVSPDQDISQPMKSKLLNWKTGELFTFSPERNDVKLAKREHQILGLISEGLISKEIADKLFISVHTVNTHRQRIIEKMQARNIHEAIRMAREYGLFDPSF